MRYIFIKSLFISLFFAFLFPQTSAQTNEETVNVLHQYWTDLNFAYQISDSWDFYSSIGYRTISPHNWDRYLITPSVRYQVPKLIWKDLKYDLPWDFYIRLGISANYDNQPAQGVSELDYVF